MLIKFHCGFEKRMYIDQWCNLCKTYQSFQSTVFFVLYWRMTLTVVQDVILSLYVFLCVQGSKLQEPCAGRDCSGPCPCLPLKGSRVSDEELCLPMLRLFIPLSWPHPVYHTSLLTANLPSELHVPSDSHKHISHVPGRRMNENQLRDVYLDIHIFLFIFESRISNIILFYSYCNLIDTLDIETELKNKHRAGHTVKSSLFKPNWYETVSNALFTHTAGGHKVTVLLVGRYLVIACEQSDHIWDVLQFEIGCRCILTRYQINFDKKYVLLGTPTSHYSSDCYINHKT